MPDVDQLRARIGSARAEAEEHAAAQRRAAVEVAAADASLERSRRRGDADAVAEAEDALAAARRTYEAAARVAKASAGRIHELQIELADAVDRAEDLFELVSAAEPILLLPVRLETRWKMTAPGSRELLIRIYPDDVHSDTFERELTEEEETWGDTYWQQTGAATNDEERRAAWAQLTGRFGPARAAWVALATDPAGTTPPQQRSGAWTRAPRSRVLPDRWVAVLITDAADEPNRRLVAATNVVPDSLATGPDPTADDAPPATGMPAIDEGMRWMVEFAEAERVGMALRVSIPAGVSRVTELLVFGVKASLAAVDSATRIEELLAAHHYTGGLGFVRPGTPTNNTSEADSGYRSRLGVADRSYAVEREAPLVAAGDGSDGDTLARDLGLDVGVFAHVAGADDVCGRDAQAMNAALWPATWGYFLDQMMAETFDEADIERGRQHFVQFVRGGGPQPSLRVRRQPYGILPVTSLDAYHPLPKRGGPASTTHVAARPDGGPQLDGALAGFLRRARDRWRASVAEAPRLGRTADVDADLVEVLGQDGISSRYAAQPLLGGNYLLNLWSFLGLGNQGWETLTEEAQARGRAQLASVGASDWSPRLLDAIFWSWVELNGPHVDGNAPLVEDERMSDTTALADNYLTWLLDAGIGALRDETYPGGRAPNALLYLLLRHSLLLALLAAADAMSGDVSERRVAVTATAAKRAWREPELVDVALDAPTAVAWDFGDVVVSRNGESTSAGRVAEDVYREGQGRPRPGAPPAPTDRVFAELRDVGAALAHLERRPTAVLDRALAQTLDLGSHRLDAWITSLATKRLTELRAAGVAGIRVGAYGWLEDLRPRRATVRPELPADAEPETDASNLGFVHAPSVGQAATAAVLQAGARSHTDADGNVLAVDLTSRRVRLAESLLEGVREGQALGALLGYRFERALHDASDADSGLELDRFILPFRTIAPLTAGRRDPSDTGALEAIAASNVVDGLALLDLHTQNRIVYGQAPLPSATDVERNAIERVLADVADVTDAVADAVLAESVHQLVQGNPTRAGATLDAIATGEAPPPDLHFARTPRTGVGVAHRLSLLFSRSVAPSAIDPVQYPKRAREDAEPELHSWVANLLGPLSRVVCHASFEWTDELGDSQTGPVEVRLSELGVAPLDIVYASMPSEQQQRTELDQRAVGVALQKRPTGTPARAHVQLDYTRSGLSTGQLSFDELLELARAVRELMAAATPLTAIDLVLPEEAQQLGASIDLADLHGRAQRARARVQLLHDDLDPMSGDKNALRAAILATSVLGVQGAVPVSPVDGSVVSQVDASALDELALLREQAASVKAELEARLDRIDAIVQPPASAGEQAAVDFELARLAEAFGAGFMIVPRFSLRGAAAAELQASFDRSADLQGGDPKAASAWFGRAARVREGAARLETVLLYGAALGRTDLDFDVAQLPHGVDERWVGLPPDSGRVPGGRLSLVAKRSAGFDAADSLAGLSIDDWVEVVPGDAEDTGVTFHFDASGTEAPQAWLVAVHPDPLAAGRETDEPHWSLETLEAVLRETLELAELRAVDEDALRGAGQFLPAAYFASNEAGDTVSTDFTRNAVQARRRRP
jgi:hypothetical protein